MSDATTQQDWKAGLTETQVSTVEKAARAAWGATSRDFTWETAGGPTKNYWYRTSVAALRAAKHPDFPEPPVKSRGEVVAEKAVVLNGKLLHFMWPDGSGQIMEMRDPSNCLRWARDAVAAHIDAEIARVLEEAAKVAELIEPAVIGNIVAKDIRALKGAQPK